MLSVSMTNAATPRRFSRWSILRRAFASTGGRSSRRAAERKTGLVFFPVVMVLDFGLPPEETAIWFGILVLIVVGIGLIAPPIGLNVFVMNALARDVPITVTYRGVLPFLATDLVRLTLVALLPGLALGLVRVLAP